MIWLDRRLAFEILVTPERFVLWRENLKVQKQRQTLTWQYSTSWLSHAHRSDPRLCLWAVHLQTRNRLFVFPGICKHPQQKQVPLEWEENLTPSGQLHSHSSAAFDVPRTALIMKTPYTLILFNWSLDVTGCWDTLWATSLPEGENLCYQGQS